MTEERDRVMAGLDASRRAAWVQKYAADRRLMECEAWAESVARAAMEVMNLLSELQTKVEDDLIDSAWERAFSIWYSYRDRDGAFLDAP